MSRTAGLVVTLAGSFVLLSAAPAAAAPADRASCVGVIVAPLASSGQLDVNHFKGLAEASGAKNFGAFVAGGARLHLGTAAACLP